MGQRIRETTWSHAHAPSLEDFEVLAEQAFSGLPMAFRELCGEILIQVADFPEDEVLDDLGLDSPYDLLGLFQGVGLAHRSLAESGEMPNMIWLFRRPMIDYWAEHEETLGYLVAHVLIHEIGHHFGLSDDDMQTIEDQAEGVGA